MFASQASSAFTLIHANPPVFFPAPCHREQPLRTWCQQTTNGSKCPGRFQTRGLFVCLCRVRPVAIQSDVENSPAHKTPLFIASSSDIDDSSRSLEPHYHTQGLHQPTCDVKLSASVSAELIKHIVVYNAGQCEEGVEAQRINLQPDRPQRSHCFFFLSN